MKRPARIPQLGGQRALVLHAPHANTTALVRQLRAIGLQAEEAWPDLPEDAGKADFLFFDVDMACDTQFPWKAGAAPMPLLAIIGSEAPGRIEWALSHRADAHLVKPLGSAGIYSALLIARRTFEERRNLFRDIEDLRAQVAERQTVVQAVLTMTEKGMSADEAYGELRRRATTRRMTLEAAAREIVPRRQAR